VSAVKLISGQGSEHQRDASARHMGYNGRRDTADMNMCFLMFSAQRKYVE